MEVMGIKNILNKFKNKKIFITGHTGFKGSWLTSILDVNGAITKGYSLEPNSNPSLYNKLNFSSNHSSVIADINDYDFLKSEIDDFEPEYIFHLAAQPLVIESYKNPIRTFETNFNGTLNLLEVLRKSKFQATAILITTDKVYENNELNVAFAEEDRIGGKDPYSASKAVCELLINSYNHSFFNDSRIKIASVRAGNVIGGGDWSEDRLVPDIVKALFEKIPIEIRNPSSTRPWQHVLEPLHGYLKLAIELSNNPNIYSGSWNFGPNEGDVKSVKEIIDISFNLGFKFNFKNTNKNKFNESKYLALKIEKSKKLLNWNPKWNSQVAIEKTLLWYEGFYAGENPNNLIEKDLENYNINEYIKKHKYRA